MAFLLIASPAYAGDDEVNRMIGILQAQRNQAMDSLAFTASKIQVLTEELNKIKSELADTKAELEKLKSDQK